MRKRFLDGFSWGLVIGFIALCAAVGLLVFIYGAGVDEGKRVDRLDFERTGGGRYVELVLDGRTYKGWVR